MFSKESISKVIGLMKECAAVYSEKAVSEIPLCISQGNRKIGRVMNVSLPPIMTCANCKECKKLCYDIKACLQYPNTVIDARIRNYTVLMKDRKEYFNRIIAACYRRRANKYFRWHVAGDIIDIDYFDNMIKIARMFPEFIFWTYTKNYKVVNEWIKNHGGNKKVLPKNLSVMFSEWRGMPMDNPYNMPVFSVVFKDDAVKPVGHYCPGNCDICKAAHRGCVVGETTYCHEH